MENLIYIVYYKFCIIYCLKQNMYYCLFPREIVSFVFPRISKNLESQTLRLSGKQNKLFPSGANVKCIIYVIM